jgi:hypothetical protein
VNYTLKKETVTNRISRRGELNTPLRLFVSYQGFGDQCELYDLEKGPEALEDLYTIESSMAADRENESEDKLCTVNWLQTRLWGNLPYPLARTF